MAQRTDFRSMACSIARTWAIVGEPWTPLILRDLTVGLRRFDDIRRDLGIATNVLSDRLVVLEREGVIERRPYSNGGRPRDEYHLTESGRALVPVLIAITTWGDDWLATAGPPALFHHEDCGQAGVRGVVSCSACGGAMTAANSTAIPGPGAEVGPGTSVIADGQLLAPKPTANRQPHGDRRSGQ